MVTEAELQNMSPEEIAELQKKNCIFCKIIAGEVPSKKVYEDDKIIAILDIRPAKAGHILVMPKDHFPILPLIPQDVATHMFQRTKDLCSALRNGLPATSATVMMANGAAAGQQSPHFLYHIIPEYSFDIPQTDTDQSDLLEPLRERVGSLMKTYLAQEGKLPPEEVQEAMKDRIAQLLETNEDMRNLLVNNTEEFKAMIRQNEQLAQLFTGIDIDKLAEGMREGVSEKPESKEEPPEEPVEEPTENSEPDLDKISRLFK